MCCVTAIGCWRAATFSFSWGDMLVSEVFFCRSTLAGAYSRAATMLDTVDKRKASFNHEEYATW